MTFKKILHQTWYFGIGFTVVSTGLVSYFVLIFSFQVHYREGMLLSQKDIPFHRTNWSTLGVETLNEWVAVEGVEIYYFSAYSENGKIVIISIAEKKDTPYRIVCRFFDKDGILLHAKTQGKINYIPEDHKKRYTASFVQCKVPTGQKPYAVALISTKYSIPLDYVPIRYVQDQKMRINFTVCICPLRLDLENGTQFVEMIELNRVLGADNFIIYDYDISPNTSFIMDYYKDIRLLEIIPWRLPLKLNSTKNSTSSNIHYFGQLAAINDCIYRSKGVSRFVVNQDIDEFIIPQKHGDWLEMIGNLPTSLESFSFRSTFFRKDWPDINDNFLPLKEIFLAKMLGSITIVKQVREMNIFSKRKRSKYIVNPKCVKTAGIHEIYRYNQNSKCKTYSVSKSFGLVHHYRYIEERGDVPSTIDTRINGFKDKLLQSICKVWTELNTFPYTSNE